MNAPHVKQFVEERDRTVNLMIDMSASGHFGSRGTTEARARRRARGGRRVLGDQEQRPRRPVHRHRQGRALRAAEEGPPSRAARDRRDPRVRADVAQDRPRGRARLPRQGRAAPLGRVPRQRLPVSDGWERAMRIARAAPRAGAGRRRRSDSSRRCRPSACSCSRTSRPARSSRSTPAARARARVRRRAAKRAPSCATQRCAGSTSTS